MDIPLEGSDTFQREDSLILGHDVGSPFTKWWTGESYTALRQGSSS